jgi:cytochrome P450
MFWCESPTGEVVCMTDISDTDLQRMYETLTAFDGVPEWASARASAKPQEMYVHLADECPVAHSATGRPILLSMDDILFVNKSRAVEQSSKFLGSNRPAIPLGLDGPEHTKYRRLLDPVFTAKRVSPLADQVRALADKMIDGFIEDGRVDAYTIWCEPLPSQIFLSIMGLPMQDLPGFLNFKELTLGNEQIERDSAEVQARKKAEAVQWIQDYFNRAIDEREARDDPGDDMLGMLVKAEAGGERLTREDLHDILGLLMIAGLDTVAGSLACYLSYFARHPEQRAWVLHDPARWPKAVEELMRFESPVTDGGRIAMEDLELPSGTKIPAGELMVMSWSAANLDPKYFPDPLEVDLDRAPNPHIGFASGFHRCLGSHLARMEMVTAMDAWHRRIPDYRVEDGVELVYSGNPRAPHHLPLVWS